MSKVRFGDYISYSSHRQRFISFNQLTPRAQYDDAGQLIPYRPATVELRWLDRQRLLTPYISTRAFEQMRAVIPLALYLALFQLLILRAELQQPWLITAGLGAVIIGLMLFMEGLKHGLMPFGELLGETLPKRLSLPGVLFIAFLLGISVTLAEPAIGALKAAGAIVKADRAPYLYLLLNHYSGLLVAVVGIGVGLAAVIGTLRFIHGWSLKPIIISTLVPLLLLSGYFLSNSELTTLLGVAWDSGAVTTGPVTVPLVLALGIGIASSAGRAGNALSGFGIVTLASLFPILGVIALELYLYFTVPLESIALMGQASTAVAAVSWFDTTPATEIIAGARAVVPLVLFLLIVIKLVLRQKIHNPAIIAYGVTLSLVGMIVFNIGLTYGLTKLGTQAGAMVPAAFSATESAANSPLYFYALGIAITIAFAWLLGFGATLAEPALNALGITVERMTNGALRKSMLLYAVAIGVGCGIAAGVVKILADVPLGYFLIPSYLLALLLTLLSNEEFVNIAWDSAGVTTGPITVPLVLAMGLGLGDVLLSIEGFGILALASIGPIISVLSVGLWVKYKVQQAKSGSESGHDLHAGMIEENA